MYFTKKKFIAAMVVALGLLSGCSSGAKSTKSPAAAPKTMYKVGIVQHVQHNALDAANKGFVDGLAANGFKERDNLELDSQNGQGALSTLQAITQRFVNNKVNLICAIATPAAQTAASATRDIPIVGTAITDYKAAKLVKENDHPGTNVTGTTDLNPLAKQLDLLQRLVPKAKTIGLLYNGSEINSAAQAQAMKDLALKRNLLLKEFTVASINDVPQAAESLVQAGVDVVYVPTDNVMASAMPVLVRITNEAEIPVICGESGMVKQGALATIGIDYYRLGVQTGAMAAKILKGEAKPQTMPIEMQKEMKVTLNETEAELLGIRLPEDLLKQAELVHMKK